MWVSFWKMHVFVSPQNVFLAGRCSWGARIRSRISKLSHRHVGLEGKALLKKRFFFSKVNKRPFCLIQINMIQLPCCTYKSNKNTQHNVGLCVIAFAKKSCSLEKLFDSDRWAESDVTFRAKWIQLQSQNFLRVFNLLQMFLLMSVYSHITSKNIIFSIKVM